MKFCGQVIPISGLRSEGSESMIDGDECPDCGGEMVVRQNRTTGDEFLGCSEFENGCRFTAVLD